MLGNINLTNQTLSCINACSSLHHFCASTAKKFIEMNCNINKVPLLDGRNIAFKIACKNSIK